MNESNVKAKVSDDSDDSDITIKQVEYWLGNDWSFNNICETLQELANGDYEQEQLREDIKSTWRSKLNTCNKENTE
tara:strand:+ start:1623 stop:1850 length:228 start_codon:yes stop_codon:yes gene_type:complete